MTGWTHYTKKYVELVVRQNACIQPCIGDRVQWGVKYISYCSTGSVMKHWLYRAALRVQSSVDDVMQS